MQFTAKSISIILLLFVNVLLSAQEQDESTNSFQGILLFGGNVTQIKGDLYKGFDKSGLHFGVGVKYGISANDKIELDLLYSQKGSRFVNSSDLESVLPFSYIDVPLTYHRMVASKLAIHGGISPNFLISTGDFFLDGIRDLSQEEAYKSFELAGVLGLTYDLSDKFLIDFRFSNSILNVRKGTAKQYHHIITIRGGLKI